MPRDSSVTVRLDESGSKPLSQAKLNQLAQARVKSLETRRRNQKAKLEGKLNAIRSLLGNDMRADTIDRVAKELVARDERHVSEITRLTEKQTAATEQLQHSVNSMRDEISRMRKEQLSYRSTSAPSKVKTLSDVGSRVSSTSSHRP